jgi:hypothetical protein
MVAATRGLGVPIPVVVTAAVARQPPQPGATTGVLQAARRVILVVGGAAPRCSGRARRPAWSPYICTCGPRHHPPWHQAFKSNITEMTSTPILEKGSN